MQPRFYRSAIVAAAFGAFALHATGAEPVHINLPAFSCHSGTYGAKLPSTLPALRSLGPLKSEEQGEVQVWEGHRTVEKWLRFEGLSVLIVTFSNDPNRYALALLEVTSPHWQVASRFRIGQFAGEVLRELGVSSPPSNGEWRVAGESDTVLLVVRNGRFTRITYECYTG
jgi:hypothetical protein